MQDPLHLSKRERQIMEAIYRRGESTAIQVTGDLADPPSRTAVRTLLGILETKGHLTHRKEGREFVYKPVKSRTQAARSALRRLLDTFFAGSFEQAAAAYLSDPKAGWSEEELESLRGLIEQIKSKRSKP